MFKFCPNYHAFGKYDKWRRNNSSCLKVWACCCMDWNHPSPALVYSGISEESPVGTLAGGKSHQCFTVGTLGGVFHHPTLSTCKAEAAAFRHSFLMEVGSWEMTTAPHFFCTEWGWAKPTTDFHRPTQRLLLRVLLTCHLSVTQSLVAETISSSHSPCCPFTFLKHKPSCSSFVLSHTCLASRDILFAPWHPPGLGCFAHSCFSLPDCFMPYAYAVSDESSLFAHMVIVGFNAQSWRTTSPLRLCSSPWRCRSCLCIQPSSWQEMIVQWGRRAVRRDASPIWKDEVVLINSD